MSVKKGGVISFRLPNDTSTDIIYYLNNLKSKTGRNFSFHLLQIFLKGLAKNNHRFEEDYIFLKIPTELSIEKRKWLQSKETQLYLLSILLQSITNMSDKKYETKKVIESSSQNYMPSETMTFIHENFIGFDND
ncbi:hypothetical protein [Fictibacillus barbaricus]|uniref:Uncharacterized protein n=1 Tax=Fictibacillus barbaricus TaxID=182136 RepID=A0ABU1U5H2_9BACL|nr:hypothetical protein [Fictibacillus barbaricus]MDR7074740.1 hypothetical protein [Fictibacillus barbaricus]